MGPIIIYYHVNTIGREYNCTHKDCPQIWTVGYNGLRVEEASLTNEERSPPYLPVPQVSSQSYLYGAPYLPVDGGISPYLSLIHI